MLVKVLWVVEFTDGEIKKLIVMDGSHALKCQFYPAVGRLPFFILLFASLLGSLYLYDLLCPYINCC